MSDHKNKSWRFWIPWIFSGIGVFIFSKLFFPSNDKLENIDPIHIEVNDNNNSPISGKVKYQNNYYTSIDTNLIKDKILLENKNKSLQKKNKILESKLLKKDKNQSYLKQGNKITSSITICENSSVKQSLSNTENLEFLLSDYFKDNRNRNMAEITIFLNREKFKTGSLIEGNSQKLHINNSILDISIESIFQKKDNICTKINYLFYKS